MPTGGGGGGAPAAPAATSYYNGMQDSQVTLGSANITWFESFQVPYKLTFGHISIGINVADAVGLYDVGVYSFAGTLLADIGAQHLPSTGVQTFATVQGAITINPAVYIFAVTGNATTASINFTNHQGSAYSNRSLASTVGGALNASITVGAVNIDVICWYFLLT